MAYRKRSRGTFSKRPSTRRGARTRGSGSRFRKPRGYYRPMGMHHTHRHHAIGFLDPFSSVRPRLMDGVLQASQTHNNRFTASYNIAQNKTAAFFLQPDIFIPLAFQTDVTSATVSIMNSPAEEIRWDTSGVPGSTSSGHVTKVGGVDRWRLVSQGLKMQLINTTDTDDGWFEAYRITSNPNMTDMVLTEFTASAGQGALIPSTGWFDEIINNATLNRERMSYSAGALKDIGKYAFRLVPVQNDHNLKHIYNDYELQGSATYAVGPPEQWSIGVDDVLPFQKLYEAQHDECWDSVVIIVHAGSTATGSTLLVDTSQNTEVVYEQTSNLAKFHQPTVSDVALHNTVRKAHQERNRKAAAPLGASRMKTE